MILCPLSFPQHSEVEELLHLDVQGGEGEGSVELFLQAPVVELPLLY